MDGSQSEADELDIESMSNDSYWHVTKRIVNGKLMQGSNDDLEMVENREGEPFSFVRDWKVDAILIPLSNSRCIIIIYNFEKLLQIIGNIEKGIESNQNLETDLEIRDPGWVNPRKTRAPFKKFPGGGTNVAEPT